jgi:hypothetical protein
MNVYLDHWITPDIYDVQRAGLSHAYSGTLNRSQERNISALGRCAESSVSLADNAANSLIGLRDLIEWEIITGDFEYAQVVDPPLIYYDSAERVLLTWRGWLSSNTHDPIYRPAHAGPFLSPAQAKRVDKIAQTRRAAVLPLP